MIQIQRKVIERIAESLEKSYYELNEELFNERPIKTNYWAANLMEINQIELNRNIDSMISVLNELKKLKEFNPQKPIS